MTARSTIVLAIAAALAAVILVAPTAAGATGSFSVVASGLDNPRGLTFGPDGNLYVALGGTGGAMMTTPQDCLQAPVPVGPYSGGFTASIVKVAPNGPSGDRRYACSGNFATSGTIERRRASPGRKRRRAPPKWGSPVASL